MAGFVRGNSDYVPNRAPLKTDPVMDRYAEYFKQCCEADIGLYKKWEKRGYIDNQLPDKMTKTVMAAVLYEYSRDAKYQEYAQRWYTMVLKDLAVAVENRDRPDFHHFRCFGTLLYHYHTRGLIKEEDRGVLIGYARLLVDFWDRTEGESKMHDHNRVIGCMVGAAAICKAFPDEAGLDTGRMQRQIDEWWRFVMETADLDENSGNYIWLGQCFFLDLARMLGRSEELKESENFKRMLLRNRFYTSPSGRVPEFGDDHLALAAPHMDLIYALEHAARLYNEPSCRSVATLAFSRQEDGKNLYKYAHRAVFLLLLDPYGGVAAPLPDPVAITQRIHRLDGKEYPDKMRLATGWGPEDSMAWFDLYAMGSHAHPNRRPQVTYLESQGVPFYYNMGRRPETPLSSTSFWIRKAASGFMGGLNPYAWNTVEFDVDGLLYENDEGKLTIDDEIRFIFSTSVSHDRTVLVDNIRLLGDNKERLIEGFEEALPEKTPKQFQVSHTDDCTEGRHALKMVRSGSAGNTAKNSYISFPLSGGGFDFTRQQYDRLALDIKVVDNDGQPTGIGLFPNKDRTSGIMFPQRLTAVSLVTRLDGAWATNISVDAFGEATFGKYVVNGNALRRQYLLTREGILIIRDSCMPNPSLTDYVGGQLWNLYTVSERGADWFCSEPSTVTGLDGLPRTRRLLVKFMAMPELVCDVKTMETAILEHAPSVETTFSRAPLSAGQVNQFALVLVPLEVGENAAQAAAAVVFTDRGAQGITVSIRRPADEAPLRISLDNTSVEIQGSGVGRPATRTISRKEGWEREGNRK